MKKKDLKEIRRIANDLPPVEDIISYEVVQVTGSSLIESGMTALPTGEKVIASNTYRKRTPKVGKVNHVEKMKDLFKVYGIEGVRAYVEKINILVIKNAEKKQTV